MEIGLLKLVQYQKYITLELIISKKYVSARFLTYYHFIKRQLACKTYLLTITGDPMYKIEGLNFATEMYLNIGYYTI